MSALAWKSLAIAAAAFVFLAAGVNRSGIAGALVNSVDGIHAQDESILVDSAMRMAAHGDWMTPVVMGRIFLYKPPMLQWLTTGSLKVFGQSLFAVRLPSLLAGSLAAGLLFFWCARACGFWAGIGASLLLLSNSVWITFSRLCYTDALLAFFSAAALFCVFRDPRLETRSGRWGFVIFDAAAILTKSAAGVLPVFVLLLFALTAPRADRPSFRRLARILAGIALLAAPWHLYQWVVHPQWFYADYVNQQFFRLGIHPPVPRSDEVAIWFYLKRLFLTDPFLCVAAAVGLPVTVANVRRKVEARLVICWLAVVLAIVATYQWRNFPYAVMLLAPFSLAAALWTPAKYQRWMVAVLALILAWKLASHGHLWSLSYPASQPLAASPLLRSYLDRGRSNELILVDTDDEFYSSTLPLPKVRYVFRDPENITVKYVPYYAELGITVTADQFNDLNRWSPIFRDRLRAWGLDSAEPIATSIIARNDEDVRRIIEAHPNADFYLPANFAPAPDDAHVAERASPDRTFLLSRFAIR